MLISFFLVGLATTIMDLISSPAVTRRKQLLMFVQDTVLINLFSLFLVRFLLQKNHLFNNDTYTLFYSIKYILFSLVIGISYLFIKRQIEHSPHLKYCTKRRSRQEKTWLTIHSVIFALGWLVWISSHWFQQLFGKFSVAKFSQLFSADPLVSSAVKAAFLNTQVVLYLTGVVVFLIFLWAPVHVVGNYRTHVPNGRIRKIGGVFAFGLLISSLLYAFN